MMRVGKGRPSISFIPGHNDMSHYFPGEWVTNDYFIMSIDEYMSKKEFDSFDMNPKHFSDEDKKEVLEYMKNRNTPLKFEECVLSAGKMYIYNMNQLINKAGGSLLWQFNAIDPQMKGWVRQCIGLGENILTRWSWFDAYVTLPLLKRKARLLNYLRRHKAQKEWDDWQAYLKEVHRKVK